MRYTGSVRLRILSLALLAAAVGLAPSAASGAELTTHQLPAGTNAGSALVADPSGIVWLAAGDPANLQPRLARIDPATLTPGTAPATLHPTPTFAGASCCATQIRTLDWDPDNGRVWFARSDGMFGYASPSELVPGTSSGFSYGLTPSAQRASLWGLSYDSFTKQTWMTEHSSYNAVPAGSPPGYYPGNRVAISSSSLGLTELTNLAQQTNPTGALDGLRYDAKPKGIAADGKGGAWFVQENPGNPGYRLAYTGGGPYTEYLISPCPGVSPCSGSFTGTGPSDVTVAKDGRVWLTNETPKEILAFDPVSTSFIHYPLAAIDPTLSAGRPIAIRKAADGTVWAAIYGGPSAPGANAIVRIVPGEGAAITTDIYKTGVLTPLAVAPSATGDVWAALSPAGGGSGSLAKITGAIAGGAQPPVDGGGGTPAPSPGGNTVLGTVGKAQAGKASTDGDTASVRQICVGPPQDKCSLIYMLDSREYVKGFPNTKPPTADGSGSRLALAPKSKKPKKKSTVRLGETRITLSGGETKTVKVRLSKKARSLLAKRGTLKATLTTYERQADGTLRVVAKKNVTFKKKKSKKK